LGWAKKYQANLNNLNVETHEIGIALKNQFEAHRLLEGWVD